MKLLTSIFERKKRRVRAEPEFPGLTESESGKNASTQVFCNDSYSALVSIETVGSKAPWTRGQRDGPGLSPSSYLHLLHLWAFHSFFLPCLPSLQRDGGKSVLLPGLL